MKVPTVSVVMATYNHAPFVAAAIESVLRQEDVDFEFIIADDGSSDDTADVVSQFSDPRIRFTAHAVNRGACTVTNELIEAARGEFVAVMNSDDVWPDADKLSYQVDLLRQRPSVGACFGRVSFVTKEGSPLPKEALSFGATFDQPNRSRGEWLRRFFYEGNCLCHPSVLIRRSCYSDLGLYDNRYRQLPDFDMWIRLLKKYDIHVSNRELVTFRIMPGENASAQTPVNSFRTINEHYLIAEGFFSGMTHELFREAFKNDLLISDDDSSRADEIEQALLMLRSDLGTLGYPYNVVGMRWMFESLRRPELAEALALRGIDDRWFQAQIGKIGIFRPDMAIADGVDQALSVERASVINPLKTTLKAVEAHDHEVQKELDRAAARCKELESQIAGIYNTRSWKLTSALRSIATAFKSR